ncbi:MAG: hypothetical protein ACOCWH_05700 [Spirochaetota bacterium]
MLPRYTDTSINEFGDFILLTARQPKGVLFSLVRRIHYHAVLDGNGLL